LGSGYLWAPSFPFALIHRVAWKGYSANFAVKLSEKSHERAKRLTIKRLIAT
jgi:hypothetical protein